MSVAAEWVMLTTALPVITVTGPHSWLLVFIKMRI